jgi:hypothetical protein
MPHLHAFVWHVLPCSSQLARKLVDVRDVHDIVEKHRVHLDVRGQDVVRTLEFMRARSQRWDEAEQHVGGGRRVRRRGEVRGVPR